MSEDSTPNGSELTRRTLMAMTGGLGLASIASQSAGAASKSGRSDPAFEYMEVVGAEGWMHDTIQAAHDALPDGGRIYVAPSYDSSAEEFPVVLHNHVRVSGGHRGAEATTIDARGSGENVFEIREGYESGQRPYDLTHSIDHLRIKGGEIGVLISPETSATLQHLVITGTNSHGVASLDQEGNSGVSFMNYIHNVHVFYAGGHGFHFPFVATNYVTRLQYCIAWRNAGIGANVGGISTSVIGGVYQNNGHHGVRFTKWGANQYARELYVAGNGDENYATEDHDYSANIQVYDSHAVIDNCYIVGTDFGGPADRGVDIQGGFDVQVRNCLFRRHTEGSVYVDDQSTNCDLHLSSHINDEEPFLIADNGELTRSDGVILPTDLSEVDDDHAFGQRAVYDVGFDDGSNTESGNPAFAMWRDGDWYSVELEKL